MQKTDSLQKPAETDRPADLAAALSGKTQSELFDALRAETDKERAMGRMNDTSMDEIYEKLAPMLTESQKAKMREVIRRLKE